MKAINNDKVLYIIFAVLLIISITLVVFFTEMMVVDWVMMIAILICGLVTFQVSTIIGLVVTFIITLLYGVIVLVTGTVDNIPSVGINYYYLLLPAVVSISLSGVHYFLNLSTESDMSIKEDNFKTLSEYENELSIEVERAKRYNLPLTLLAIRIESLDELINLYGEQVGERFITHFSDFIVEITRQSDQHYRLEDKLFMMILPCTDYEGAILLKERFIKEFEAMEVIVKSSYQPVHVEVDIVIEALEDHISAKELHELIEIELTQRGEHEENL